MIRTPQQSHFDPSSAPSSSILCIHLLQSNVPGVLCLLPGREAVRLAQHMSSSLHVSCPEHRAWHQVGATFPPNGRWCSSIA